MDKKYFLCAVEHNTDGARTLFYAYNKAYGLHKTDDINNPDIVKYENEEDAIYHKIKMNECVLWEYA